MPIKQPGDIGPKPIIANTENTQKHIICAEFMVSALVFIEGLSCFIIEQKKGLHCCKPFQHLAAPDDLE